ncbi:MAG: hypothetical protein Q7R48_02320 [bacterium]|nr:hypothetical protein [bacterium]
MPISKYSSSQSGQAALFAVLLLAAASLAIGAGFFGLAIRESVSSRTLIRSLQTYAAAESGVEDALLRLKSGMDWQNELSLSVGGVVSSVTISDPIGGSQTILAQGNLQGLVRKTESVVNISSDNPLFSYGAQIGDGGLVMDNLSRVIGNVFSNGNITGSSGAVIEGTVQVAGFGKRIEEVSVEGDVFADRCEESDINGVLHANTEDDCDSDSFQVLGAPADPLPLPISSDWIQERKDEAVAGGTSSAYALSGSSTALLGPRKIQGNLTVDNSAQLTIAGTVWVTGNVDIKNEALVKLAPSYGSTSGVVIADGKIILQNNSVSQGSGQAGAYLMYLSTGFFDDAVTIKNNAVADILYTSQGTVVIENNAAIREVAGYRVHVKNNAVLTYEIGIRDPSFSNGTAGPSEIISWRETE